MRKIAILMCVSLLGAAPPPSTDAKLRAIVAPVSQARLRHTIETLVGFGTRHTLSSQTDPKRGIGAALGWTKAQFESFGLPTVRPCETMSGERLPGPTRICDMVAIQRGTERPNDVVIITGHIDSRVSDVMNFTSDAPGANDDGSGTAAVIEAAEISTGLPFMSARPLMSRRGCDIRICGSFWNTAITAFSGRPCLTMFIAMKLFEPMPKSAAPPASNCGTFTSGPPCTIFTSRPRLAYSPLARAS